MPPQVFLDTAEAAAAD